MTEKKLLDLSGTITAPYFSAGRKTVDVTWPTDEMWCERHRRQKVLVLDLGRGRTERTMVNVAESNMEMLAKIRVDGGPMLDGAEASQVIGWLDNSQIIFCEINGDRAVVELAARGVATMHTLRMPTAQEISDYEKASVAVTSVPRGREHRSRLEPSAELYNRLLESVEGYASLPPITHKEAVIGEVLRQINQLMEEADPEQ